MTHQRNVPLTVVFVAGLISLTAIRSPAAASIADELSSKGLLGIPLAQARQLEARLGQLFVVNVDGFGYTGSLALEPPFAPMLSDLQIGGVIPHYGSTDFVRIRRTNRALAGMTDLPLLICCDIVRIKGRTSVGSFGDGYVGGFLGKFKAMPDGTLEILARLNAFALAGLGINVALGPTVDSSTADPRTAERAGIVLDQLKRLGLEPTLKHFPSLPSGANLHKESTDTRIPLEKARERADAFTQLAGRAGIMMSTHYYDSLVDTSLATFSTTWTGLLRSWTGFDGLLMSDGLLMLKNYADRNRLDGGPPSPETAGLDQAAVWAIRAILAGHDMVIVEGSPAQTRAAFKGVLSFACRGTTLGSQLRSRIEQSYTKIARWKKSREPALRRVVEVPPSLMQDVVSLLPPEGAALGSYQFDPAMLARVEPAIRAAETAP